MPAALERKLKRQAAKDPSIKDKDAYVYGTLRKTGWKPSTQKKKTKKMNDPSETINFAELPNVGSSLERLRGIVGKRIEQLSKPPTLRGGGWFEGVKSPYAQSVAQQGIRVRVTGGAKAPPWNTATKGKPFQSSGMAPRLFKDPSKLVRLAQIDDQLDSIVRFAYNDDEDNKTSPYLKAGAVTAGATGVGAAGLYGLGKMAPVSIGGQGLGLGGVAHDVGYGLRPIGRGIAQGAGVVKNIGAAAGGAAKSGFSVVKDLLRRGALKTASVLASSKDELVQLDEKILEPASAEAVPHTKIIQEQFPAGLSPAAALKMPFPELMKLLKSRNILQQQFPGFSKLGKLIELNSKVDGLLRT